VLLESFFIVLPLLVVSHLLTPSDLWILAPQLRIRPPALDLAFALFLYAAGFFGGILQLYNLAERGFSLRILIDVLHSPAGTMTLDQVMKHYGAGRGIAWMYDKRVADMAATGLVFLGNARLTLTRRGRRVAALFSWLQRFAGAEES
jgi:hypothetical protein